MGLIAKVEKEKHKQKEREKETITPKKAPSPIQETTSTIKKETTVPPKIKETIPEKLKKEPAAEKPSTDTESSPLQPQTDKLVEQYKTSPKKISPPPSKEPPKEDPPVEELKAPQKKEAENKEEPPEPNDDEIDFTSIKSQIEQELHHTNKKGSPETRTHTGIEGLDEVMEGGLRTGSVTLVGGGAGSGKSIFAMQTLVEGARKHNEAGVYISFEEKEEKIVQDFSSFSWDLKQLIEDKKVTILTYNPDQVERFLEAGGGMIRDLIEKVQAKRLVIDSLTAFSLLFPTDLERRQGILKLFETLASWGLTTIMLSEQEPDPEKHISSILEFQVDGVILLYNTRKGDVRERSLEVFKMRATKHSAKIFPMQISDQGVTIFPEETVF